MIGKLVFKGKINSGYPKQCAHVKISCKGLWKRAKKVLFDSPGLVDFAIELYGILFFTWPMGKWSILRNSTYRRTVKSILLIQKNLGASWNDVWAFFAPCYGVTEIPHPEHNSRNAVRRLTCSKLKCYTTLIWRETLLPQKEVSHQKPSQASPLTS